MKRKWIFGLLLMSFLLVGISVTGFADTTGPEIRWIGPAEGFVARCTSSSPEIGVAVEAEDPDGIKQGVMWLIPGHADRGVAGDGPGSRIWGHTFVSGGVAPPAANAHFMLRMLGRAQGEYTLKVVFHDNGSLSRGTLSYRHFIYDNDPPTVRFANLTNNQTTCKDRSLVVKIEAADTGAGIRKVTLDEGFFAKGRYYGVKSAPPYDFVINKSFLTRSPMTLRAIATDKAGRKATVRIQIKPTRICTMMMRRTIPTDS